MLLSFFNAFSSNTYFTEEGLNLFLNEFVERIEKLNFEEVINFIEILCLLVKLDSSFKGKIDSV